MEGFGEADLLLLLCAGVNKDCAGVRAGCKFDPGCGIGAGVVKLVCLGTATGVVLFKCLLLVRSSLNAAVANFESDNRIRIPCGFISPLSLRLLICRSLIRRIYISGLNWFDLEKRASRNIAASRRAFAEVC